MIYFDNAATTYPKPIEVYDGVNFAMKNYSFNAGRGSYKFSKITFDMIEETREKLASLVLEQKNKVIFTGSATESLNNIIFGLCLKVYKYKFMQNCCKNTHKIIYMQYIKY